MVQIITHPNQPGLRYWGYQPVAYDSAPLAERREIQGKFQQHCLKPTRYGIRARIAAHKLAADIERTTGVPMSIFQHDYL